ncbi:hypothetical protein [Streptomyces paradoxus]|uniref:hypothetical protein n=1 Tax=Streptomyces paradoxus TaxID=66375 RepID=UPI003817D6E4
MAVKITALPCRAAARVTQASTASGRFFAGRAARPRAVPMRRQSARSGPVAQARHSGRPVFVSRMGGSDVRA